MKNRISAYLIAVMLLVTVTALGGTVIGTATEEYTFGSYDREDFVNSSVIAEYYGTDDRTDDYMLETFNDCSGNDCSAYDIIDGITDPALGGQQTGVAFTSSPSESFGGSAVFINTSDGETAGAADTAVLYLSNSTLDDEVFTLEFDFMLDNDDEDFVFMIEILSEWALVFNHTADGANDTIHTALTTPDIGSSLGFELAEGVWHHLILSVCNDMVNGLVVTVFISNTTIEFTDSRDSSLTTLENGRMALGPLSGADAGSDFVFDNIAYYNGSFNTSEVTAALSGTYISAQLGSFFQVALTLGIIGMIIGVVKRVSL